MFELSPTETTVESLRAADATSGSFCFAPRRHEECFFRGVHQDKMRKKSSDEKHYEAGKDFDHYEKLPDGVKVGPYTAREKKKLLETIQKDRRFFKAVLSLPKCDLTIVKQQKLDSDFDDMSLRVMLAMNRWMNPCCNRPGCGEKQPERLGFCPRCYLTYYCGSECREKDRATHAERCGNPDGPPDEGPFKIAIIKIGKQH